MDCGFLNQHTLKIKLTELKIRMAFLHIPNCFNQALILSISLANCTDDLWSIPCKNSYWAGYLPFNSSYFLIKVLATLVSSTDLKTLRHNSENASRDSKVWKMWLIAENFKLYQL